MANVGAIKKTRAVGILQLVFGWNMALLNGLITGVGARSLFDDEDLLLSICMVCFFAVLTGIGIWLIARGCKNLKMIRIYHIYAAQLAANPSIDMLASGAGIPAARATKNICDMIAMGFFPNCAFDREHNRLLMATELIEEKQMRAVECPNCHGTTKIAVGTSGYCSFCGSRIS